MHLIVSMDIVAIGDFQTHDEGDISRRKAPGKSKILIEQTTNKSLKY